MSSFKGANIEIMSSSSKQGTTTKASKCESDFFANMVGPATMPKKMDDGSKDKHQDRLRSQLKTIMLNPAGF